MPSQRENAEDLAGSPIKRVSVSSLVDLEFKRNWLVEPLILEREPVLLAGAKKTLKTSVLIDLGISLTSGLPFLGRFTVPSIRRVGMMTGESGLPTVAETVRRIAHSKGVDPHDLEGFTISEDLPVLGSEPHLGQLRAWIAADQLEVLIVDPIYLCLDNADAKDAGNLFIIGSLLRSITTVCREANVTLILVHHTRKTNIKQSQPIDLDQIAWAGFAEHARQWMLLGHREKYVPGTGEHRLWLSAGGSAGQGGQWGLDVREGVFAPGSSRYWQVNLLEVETIVQEQANRKAEKAKARRSKHVPDDQQKILAVLARRSDGETKTQIKTLTGLRSDRFAAAWPELLKAGTVVPCEFMKANRKTPSNGYRLAESA